MGFILVQTSTETKETAQDLADSIVAMRLASGCWVSGPITSTYWWKGKIEHAQEWVCSFKTRAELYSQLEQAIKEKHTYEVPEIVAVPIAAGSQSFLDWVRNETNG